MASQIARRIERAPNDVARAAALAPKRHPGPASAGAPGRLLDMQRTVGNRAVAGLVARVPQGAPGAAVQRYVLGAATTSSSPTNMSSQVRTTGSFRDPHNLAQMNIVGIDPTVTVGTNPPLKISEDGRMAIENASDDRQAKVFFGEPGVIASANKKLAEVGSAYLLQVRTAGAITVDDQKNKPHTLDAIEPVVNPQKGKKGKYSKIAPTLGTQVHGDAVEVNATCIAVAEKIMGHAESPSKSFLKALKLFSALDQAQWPAALAEALTLGGKRGKAPIDEAQIAKDYALLLRNHPVAAAKVAKKLGINEFADPHVGEAFSSYAVGISPGVPTNAHWDPTTDPGSSNPELRHANPANRSGTERAAWGNHIGAVVAESGGDKVTFENYARDAEEGALVDNDKFGYFAMYGPVTKPAQTWHGVWANGATPIPNAVTAVV